MILTSGSRTVAKNTWLIRKVKKLIRTRRRSRIIGKKGVSGLTMAAIAREVGLSEASLYRHFKNKDEIFYATVESSKSDVRVKNTSCKDFYARIQKILPI